MAFRCQPLRLYKGQVLEILNPHGELDQMQHGASLSTAPATGHTGRTMLAGVLGWPVAHSLSPRLHGYWLDRHGIDGAYLPLPTRPEDFAAAVRGLAAAGFRGANVTVPHKQVAFALCDMVDAAAARAGAVNTLVFETPHRILGSNTDGAGFLASLRGQGVDPAAGPALILGAGGAARAIAAALLDAGALVIVTARRPEAAEALAALLPGLAVCPWPPAALTHTALLVNATTGGMEGKAGLDLALEGAPPSLTVADIVYTPRRTPLLLEAQTRGLRTVEGIDMLLQQAAAGFEAWFGQRPAVDAAVRDFVLAPPI